MHSWTVQLSLSAVSWSVEHPSWVLSDDCIWVHLYTHMRVHTCLVLFLPKALSSTQTQRWKPAHELTDIWTEKITGHEDSQRSRNKKDLFGQQTWNQGGGSSSGEDNRFWNVGKWVGHPGDTSEESLCWNQFSWFFFEVFWSQGINWDYPVS